MSEEEKKTKLKSLIEDYEIGYKESKYEGNVEEYKSLKETHKLLKDTLNYIDKLQKENEELKTINSMQKYRIEVIDERELISKDKIRKFIKEELPDDEIMECCEMFDSNGVYLRKKLEEILEENE